MFQVQNCQASCTTSFSSVPADMASCRLTCNNVAAESCKADCGDTFPSDADAEKRTKCAAGCAALCALSSDSLSFQTGVSTQWLRALCPAYRMPVCLLGLGSSASGNLIYFYDLNLNTLAQCCGSGWISIKFKDRIRIRIRINVISWIRFRICINMQISQNVWEKSLFEHFFKVLSL
jgi:hypothetical protein